MEFWSDSVAVKSRILIVDDQPVNILVLHELFRHECEVFMAMNGEEALQKSFTVLPDVILLDIQMDSLDGHEVCRRLKEDSRTCDIPVIFITAQGAVEDEVKGLQLGAVDFIVKPINPVIVKARVKTHITLKRQSDVLRSLALLDGLTGVANRRKFDEDYMRSWKQSARSENHLSVVMIDVDYFKRYNDEYGHLQGDLCLKSVATALQSALTRPYDLLARYGGEEFVAVLPETSLMDAVMVAERMRSNIENLRIVNITSDISEFLTVSLGVSTMMGNKVVAPQELLEAADRQLYQAKQAGRARISFSERY